MHLSRESAFAKFTTGTLVALFVVPSLFLAMPPKKTGAFLDTGFLGGVAGVVGACTGINDAVTGFISGIGESAVGAIGDVAGSAISGVAGAATESGSGFVASSAEEAFNQGDVFAGSGGTFTNSGISSAMGLLGENRVPVDIGDKTGKSIDKNTKALKQKEGCSDAIAYALAKSLLVATTRSIVDWINNGFEGDPLFISDPQGFFRDVLDQATGIFFIELGQTKICEPLRAPIIKLLLTSRYQDRVQCTLSTVLQNVEDFSLDFRNGGWAAWIQINEPQNNIYGLAYLTADELQRQRAERERNARNEVDQGQGFIGFKKCLEYTKETITYDADQTESGVAETEEVNGPCKRETTLTPGQIVAEQMKFVSTSDARQKELADEVNESIALVFDTLLNKLLTDGIASLSSSSSGNNNYYGSTDWSQPTVELQNVAFILQQIYTDALEFASIERLGLTVAPALNTASACYLELDALEQARAAALSAQSQSGQSQVPAPGSSTYRDTATSLQEKRNEYITLTANFPTDIGLINGATTTLQALIDRANVATTQQQMDQIMLDYAGTLAPRLPSTDAVTVMQAKRTQFEYDLGYAQSSLEQCQNLKTTVFSPTPSAGSQ